MHVNYFQNGRRASQSRRVLLCRFSFFSQATPGNGRADLRDTHIYVTRYIIAETKNRARTIIAAAAAVLGIHLSCTRMYIIYRLYARIIRLRVRRRTPPSETTSPK